jgi:hypothetical protein
MVLLIRRTVRPRGYASGLHSLRPCWTAFLSILQGCSALSPDVRVTEILSCSNAVRDWESGRKLDWFSISFRGCLTCTEDLSKGRLQTGVLERLAEHERLCSWVVLSQSQGPQAEYKMRRFLSDGSREDFGHAGKHSECERGDLGMGRERLEWCRSQDIDCGCPAEQ